MINDHQSWMNWYSKLVWIYSSFTFFGGFDRLTLDSTNGCTVLLIELWVWAGMVLNHHRCSMMCCPLKDADSVSVGRHRLRSISHLLDFFFLIDCLNINISLMMRYYKTTMTQVGHSEIKCALLHPFAMQHWICYRLCPCVLWSCIVYLHHFNACFLPATACIVDCWSGNMVARR